MNGTGENLSVSASFSGGELMTIWGCTIQFFLGIITIHWGIPTDQCSETTEVFELRSLFLGASTTIIKKNIYTSLYILIWTRKINHRK